MRRGISLDQGVAATEPRVYINRLGEGVAPCGRSGLIEAEAGCDGGQRATVYGDTISLVKETSAGCWAPMETVCLGD